MSFVIPQDLNPKKKKIKLSWWGEEGYRRDFVQKAKDLIDIINSRFGWDIAEQAQNLFSGYEPGVDTEKFNYRDLTLIYDFVRTKSDEPSQFLIEKLENYFKEEEK